jgi:hypothetical protein
VPILRFPPEEDIYIYPSYIWHCWKWKLEGALTNDVVSSSWGLKQQETWVLQGRATVRKGIQVVRSTKLLTHADLVRWMGPGTSLYTNDTNVAYILNKCSPAVSRECGGSYSDDRGERTARRRANPMVMLLATVFCLCPISVSVVIIYCSSYLLY